MPFPHVIKSEGLNLSYTVSAPLILSNLNKL